MCAEVFQLLHDVLQDELRWLKGKTPTCGIVGRKNIALNQRLLTASTNVLELKTTWPC